MKKLLSFIILVFILSCKKGNISFELLNNEVISKHIQNDSLEFFYQAKKFNNEKELNRFTNQVKFRVTNNSDKKYLFYLNSLNLNDIYNIDIIIEDEDKKVVIKNITLIDGTYTCKLGSLLEQYYHQLDVTEKKLKKIGYNTFENSIKVYFNQSVVIDPNDSYVFNMTLSLPFVVEDKEENIRWPIYYRLDPSRRYTFKLKYKLKNNLEKILSKEMLKNLKDNNIEIFKGEIETQKIPIKFK